MFRKQKQAFRAYCETHAGAYRVFNGWLHRNTNRALRDARRARGIDRNLAVFSSYNMASFNDNPYYISLALHNMRPQTDIVWIFKDAAAARARYRFPDWVRCVGWNTPEGIDAFGRARVLVDNWQKYDFLRLGRKQVYLYSAHHDRTFKDGGLARDDRLYNRMVETHATVATIGSRFGREAMRRYYHYRGPCLEDGLPRNDLLVVNDPADEARIRARLGIDAGTGILLYAPTFRDAATRGGQRQRVSLDLSRVLDALEQTDGRPWVCLHRAHYQSLGLGLADKAPDPRLRDATAWPEMAELLRVADALISDYSCCAGDYALRGKPIYLYVDDIDEYAARSRDLWVNPLDTPYWCARTPEELDALIRRTTPKAAADSCRAVLEYYGAFETGHAAESAARFICGALDGKP